MPISQIDKQTYEEYLKSRGVKDKKDGGLEKPVDLIYWCVEDIISKNNKVDLVEKYYEYIFLVALNKLEENMEYKDAVIVQESVSPSNIDIVLLTMFENSKYLEAFLIGVAFGYTKLCMSLGIEADESHIKFALLPSIILNNKKTN